MTRSFSRYQLLAFGLLMAACSSPQRERVQQPTADSLSGPDRVGATKDSVTAPAPATIAAAKAAPARAAQAVVAALYTAHNADQGPFFQSESRVRIRQYFTSELTEQIWRDARNSLRGERARLETDPLYNTRDTDIKEFSIRPALVKNNRARVRVTFSSLGAKKTFTFLLEPDNGDWRINDIRYDDGSRLSQKLRGQAEGQ